jgi:hypothetical protein
MVKEGALFSQMPDMKVGWGITGTLPDEPGMGFRTMTVQEAWETAHAS